METLQCSLNKPCDTIKHEACCRASNHCQSQFKRRGGAGDGDSTGLTFMLCITKSGDDDDYTYGGLDVEPESATPDASTMSTSAAVTIRKSATSPSTVGNHNRLGFPWNVDQQTSEHTYNNPTPISSFDQPGAKIMETASIAVVILATLVVVIIVIIVALTVYGPCTCACWCCKKQAAGTLNDAVTAYENPLFSAVGSLFGGVDDHDNGFEAAGGDPGFYMDIGIDHDGGKQNYSILFNDVYVSTEDLSSDTVTAAPMVLLCTESEEDV